MRNNDIETLFMRVAHDILSFRRIKHTESQTFQSLNFQTCKRINVKSQTIKSLKASDFARSRACCTKS